MSTPTVALRRLVARSSNNPSHAGPVWAAFIVLTVIAWIVVAVAGGQLLTVANLQNMAHRSIALGLVTIGQAVVLLAGSIDLSVAYTVSVTAVVGAVVMNGQSSRVPLAVIAVLAIAIVIGLVNGLVVTALRVNGFIATLGMRLILGGILITAYSDYAGHVPKSFRALAYNKVAGVPISLLFLLGVAAVAWYLLQQTALGYHVFGIGGSPEVASLSGVRTSRTMIAAHVFCALCACCAGIYLMSLLGPGDPNAAIDSGYDLDSIAAAVVGGVAITGGRGSIGGALAGIAVLSVIDTTFNTPQLGVSDFTKTLVRGIIIIAAVALYRFRERRSEP